MNLLQESNSKNLLKYKWLIVCKNYLVVLCRRSIITSTSASEQFESRRVTGTIQRLERKVASIATRSTDQLNQLQSTTTLAFKKQQ